MPHIPHIIVIHSGGGTLFRHFCYVYRKLFVEYCAFTGWYRQNWSITVSATFYNFTDIIPYNWRNYIKRNDYICFECYACSDYWTAATLSSEAKKILEFCLKTVKKTLN